MMVYTHVLFAVLSLKVLESTLGFNAGAAAYAAAAIASILPDIDHPNSYIGKRALLLSETVYSAVGHRTLTHSLVGLVAAGVLSLFIEASTGLSVTIPFIVGHASHILSDMLNDAGVALLYPSPRRYHLLPESFRIRTSSAAETALAAIICACIGFMLGR